MTPYIGTASGTKGVTEIHIGTAGGNRAVTEGWVGTASGARQFYAAGAPPPDPDPEPDPITASVSPDALDWYGDGSGSNYISYPVTVTVLGGSGSYSIEWTVVSGAAAYASSSGLTPFFTSPFGNATTMQGQVTDLVSGAQTLTNTVSLI